MTLLRLQIRNPEIQRFLHFRRHPGQHREASADVEPANHDLNAV